MSTHSESSGKRERILLAAEQTFAKRGFYNSRVSDIAKEAGVADGTIYLYFKSKDDVLISLFETRMEFVNETLSAAVGGTTGFRPRLTVFIETYLRLVADKPIVAEVLTVELRQSSKFMKEYSNPRFGEFLKILAAIFEEGQRAGECKDQIPPSVAARALFGMLDELALAWVLGKRDKFDIVRAAGWIGDLTLTGLAQQCPAEKESQ